MIHAYTISNSSGVLFPVVGADTSLPWKHLIHIYIYYIYIFPLCRPLENYQFSIGNTSSKKFHEEISLVYEVFFLLNGFLSTSFVYVALVHMTHFTSSNVGRISGTLESASCPRIRRRPMSWPPRTQTKQWRKKNRVGRGQAVGQCPPPGVVTLIRHSNGTSELGVSSNWLLEKTWLLHLGIASPESDQMSDYLLEKSIWKEVGGKLQDFSLGGWMQVSLRRVWTVWFREDMKG